MSCILLKRASRAATLCGSTVVKVLSVFVSDCVERPPWMIIVVVFSTGFHFFDLFEKDDCARCFGKGFWVVREGPAGHLGVSRRGPGGVLGSPRGVRRGPGGILGESWESLGRSWGDLGTTFSAVGFRIDFLVDLERQKGAQREAFGEAKGSQNRSQNDPQTTLNRRRF